ncbi:condensation domain-containing protein, partial [Rhodococcoides yunnanense]|uniref:condensation domain-containing protein n=1 Tax=Rhodococcoides yunnanense TaxID=278209 RepID=UPI001C3F9DFF
MIFIGSGSLLWRAVRYVLDVGDTVDLVLHPAEDVPAWASDVVHRDVVDPNDHAAEIAEATTDGIVWSIGNPFVLRQQILRLGLRIVNVHGGLLPQHRGMPVPVSLFALLRGEREFGVTLHTIDAGIDTGETLAVRRFDIAPGTTLEGLVLDVSESCALLFESEFRNIVDDKPMAKDLDEESRDVGTPAYFGIRQLPELADFIGTEQFGRATDLGTLRDAYAWYQVVFDRVHADVALDVEPEAVRLGVARTIADLGYWEKTLARVSDTQTAKVRPGSGTVRLPRRTDGPIDTSAFLGSLCSVVLHACGDSAVTAAVSVDVHDFTGSSGSVVLEPYGFTDEELGIAVLTQIDASAEHCGLTRSDVHRATGTDIPWIEIGLTDDRGTSSVPEPAGELDGRPTAVWVSASIGEEDITVRYEVRRHDEGPNDIDLGVALAAAAVPSSSWIRGDAAGEFSELTVRFEAFDAVLPVDLHFAAIDAVRDDRQRWTVSSEDGRTHDIGGHGTSTEPWSLHIGTNLAGPVGSGIALGLGSADIAVGYSSELDESYVTDLVNRILFGAVVRAVGIRSTSEETQDFRETVEALVLAPSPVDFSAEFEEPVFTPRTYRFGIASRDEAVHLVRAYVVAAASLGYLSGSGPGATLGAADIVARALSAAGGSGAASAVVPVAGVLRYAPSGSSLDVTTGPGIDDTGFDVLVASIRETARRPSATTARFDVGDPVALRTRLSARAQGEEILADPYWFEFAEDHSGIDSIQFELGAPTSWSTGPVRTERSVDAVVGIVVDWLTQFAGESADLGDGAAILIQQSTRPAETGSFPGSFAHRYPVFVGRDDRPEPGASYAEWFAALGPEAGSADYQLLENISAATRGVFDELPDPVGLVVVDEYSSTWPGTARALVSDVPLVVQLTYLRAAGGREFALCELTVSSTIGQIDPDHLAASITGLGNPGDTLARVPSLVLPVEFIEPATTEIDLVAATELRLGRLIREVWPVSPLQEGFYFHFRMANESGVADMYCSQATTRLRGALDRERLRLAFGELLTRNPNLTAGFTDVDDRILQFVPDRFELPFEVFEVDEVRSRGVDAILEELSGAPFFAESPPLIRLAVLVEPGGYATLALTYEHIVIDGWSLGLLWSELFALYTGERVGPAVSYWRYLEWLGNRDAAHALAEWKSYLTTDASPTLFDADADAERNSVAPAADHLSYVQGQPARDLNGAAQRAGVTIGSFLQFGWGLYLGRTLGFSKAIFGTTVSGRPADVAGSDRIIGLLFNTVPVVVDIDSGSTVGASLTRFQLRSASVADEFYIGLAQIQREVGLSQLFDTLFIIQNHGTDGEDGGTRLGDDIEIVDGDLHDSTYYPLSFAVYPGPDGIRVRCSYRTDMVTEDEVARIVERLTGVWAQMADDLDRTIGSIA